MTFEQFILEGLKEKKGYTEKADFLETVQATLEYTGMIKVEEEKELAKYWNKIEKELSNYWNKIEKEGY